MTLDRSKLASGSRYTSELQSEQLPKLLDLLGRHMGLIEVVKGFKSPFENTSRQTEVSAAAWLTKRISSMAITLGHIDRREGEEIVLLKGEKGVVFAPISGSTRTRRSPLAFAQR